MKTITLTISGFSITNAFTTMVRKVIDPTGASKIVLDEMPQLELSLNGESAESLGIIEGSQVTLTPITESTKTGSFTLSVGQPKKKSGTTVAPTTRGSSPAYMMNLSNTL